MNSKFRIISFAILSALLISSVKAYAEDCPFAETSIKIYMDGKMFAALPVPVAENSNIYIPLRKFASFSESQIEWIEAEDTAVMSKNGNVAYFREGDNAIMRDGVMLGCVKAIAGFLKCEFEIGQDGMAVFLKTSHSAIAIQTASVVPLQQTTSFTKDNVSITPYFRSASFALPYADNITYQIKMKLNAGGIYKDCYMPVKAKYRGVDVFLSGAGNLTEGGTYHMEITRFVDGVQSGDPVEIKFATLKSKDSITFESFMPMSSDITTEATFENCSVYLPFDTNGEDVSCDVFYRKAVNSLAQCVGFFYQPPTDWTKAFIPVYDSTYKNFRISIVGLEEDTTYEIKAEIKKDGNVLKTFSGFVKTLNPNPPIAEEISISEIYQNGDGALLLMGIEGSANGWIKIKGDGETVIDGGILSGDNLENGNQDAVFISDCKYLMLEGLTIRGGGINGIQIANSSENIRVINCDISNWGRTVTLKNNIGSFEAAYVDDTNERVNNDAAIRISDVKNIVVERCYIHDPRGKANSWKGAEQTNEKGETVAAWSSAHPGGPNGIYVRGKGGIVVRYNDIIGSDAHRFNDCIEGASNDLLQGSFSKDSDIYGNTLAFSQDDAIELDGGAMNVRFYNNRIEQTYTNISTAPTIAGPSYVFRNLVFNGGDKYGDFGAAMKNGGGIEYSLGITYIFNNTFHTSGSGIREVGFGDKTSEAKRELYRAFGRNNIVVVDKGPNAPAIGEDYYVPGNSFDYDYYGNPKAVTESHAANLIQKPIDLPPDAVPHEQNGIKAYPFDEKRPTFVSLENGDFRPDEYNLGIDKGTLIDGFTNDIADKKPDIGAFEYGSNHFLPYRPIDVVSDKYLISLNSVKTSDVFTLSAGSLDAEMRYNVHVSEAVSPWLSVTPAEGVLNAEGETTFAISLDSSKITKNAELAVPPDSTEEQTIFIVRFENGYSIPITVSATK